VVLHEAERPPETVAEHLAALIPEGSSEVARSLARTAQQAGESSQAIRWLRRALAEAAPEPPRAELLQHLGQLELVARESASIVHLREALELTTEPSVRAQMGISLAEILAHAGQWEEMIAVMRSVEPDVQADTEVVQVQFASVLAVATAHDAARVHMFDRERERLEALSHGPSWSAHALAALLASISAQRGEPPDYPLRTAERSLSDGILLAEQGGGGWAAPHMLGAFILSDANERALALCDQVEAASLRTGSSLGPLLAAGYRGWIHGRLGDLVQAETEFRRTLELIPDGSMQMIAATFFFVVSDVLLERPGLSHLHATVEAMKLEPAFMETWSGGMHLWTSARVRLLNRDHSGGIADLRTVARIAGALRVGPSLAPWRSVLALALGPEEHGEAIALVEEELELSCAATLPRTQGVALRALGLLTPGETGVDILREAVDVLAGSPARFEHARALVELGAALRRSRHRSEARRPLREGLELATVCGAPRLAARARAELAAAAGRPPRREPTDEMLTASELRVARLAVAGASNREIARDLYVSTKTVETHLSHVYAKLGLAGRGARHELSSVLAVYEPN
jgi:DNA-binding CsgD family transcriptional regulator